MKSLKLNESQVSFINKIIERYETNKTTGVYLSIYHDGKKVLVLETRDRDAYYSNISGSIPNLKNSFKKDYYIINVRYEDLNNIINNDSLLIDSSLLSTDIPKIILYHYIDHILSTSYIAISKLQLKEEIAKMEETLMYYKTYETRLSTFNLTKNYMNDIIDYMDNIDIKFMVGEVESNLFTFFKSPYNGITLISGKDNFCYLQHSVSKK